MRLFDYNFPVQESVEPKNNKPDADVIYLLESILESVQGKVSKYNKDEKVQFKLKGLLNQFVKENNVLLDRKDLKLVCKVDEASTYENLNIVLNDKGYLSEALHPIINDLVKEVYEDFRVDLEKYHYYIDTGNGDNSKLRIARESNYVKVEEMDADLVATLAAPILAYILLLISLFFADKQGKKRNQALKKIVNYYERFHEKDIPIPFEDMRVEVLTLQHDSKIPKEYKSFKIFECPKMFESEKNGERRYDVNVYRVLMYKGKPVILIEGFLKHQHLDVYGNTWVDWVDNIPYQALDPKLKKFEDYYLMKILVSYLDATNLNLIKNDEDVKRFVKNFEKELQSNPNYEEAKKIAKEKKRLIKEGYSIDGENNPLLEFSFKDKFKVFGNKKNESGANGVIEPDEEYIPHIDSKDLNAFISDIKNRTGKLYDILSRALPGFKFDTKKNDALRMIDDCYKNLKNGDSRNLDISIDLFNLTSNEGRFLKNFKDKFYIDDGESLDDIDGSDLYDEFYEDYLGKKLKSLNLYEGSDLIGTYGFFCTRKDGHEKEFMLVIDDSMMDVSLSIQAYVEYTSETVGESLQFVSCNEGLIRRMREIIS